MLPEMRDPDAPADEGEEVYVVALFIQGYRDRAAGDERLLALEERVYGRVIPCESGWNPDPPGYHLGLAQFNPGTWRAARRAPEADYRDAYEQGWSVANWIARLLDSGSHPGGSGGWGYCWWR